MGDLANMSEEQNQKIVVEQSNRFRKSLERLPEDILEKVEDEIDNIKKNPKIGQQKKGDLSYLRVHKFKVLAFEYLLGYSWQESKLQLYLLQLGSHENFYDEMKTRRKPDLKLVS